ncbi:MAG: DJ-1/PfpI family protein [Myxococcota bacterium]
MSGPRTPRGVAAVEIAILLFDRLTALDAVGPYEVLSRLPGTVVRWVAVAPGPQRTEGGLGLLADRALSEVLTPDVIVIPGGMGSRLAMRDGEILEWVRTVHGTTAWTTSVCTGALILGAAGVLKGLRATSHWTQLERLREFGAHPVSERTVRQGKVITASGVSAGIDMGLRLAQLIAGDTIAQAIQLSIEYDPDPPFAGGSPEKSPAEVVELVRAAASRAAPR